MYGEKIREIRTKKKDSIRSLADKIDYSHATLGKVELGQVKASIELLEKIAKVYDISINYFLVPDELKNAGVQWIEFAKEVEEKQITADEIRAALKLIEEIKNKK